MKKWISGIFLGISAGVMAQSFNDGPIQLQVKVRDFNTTFQATDEGVFGVGFAPDELSYKVWVRDVINLDGQGWVGGNCLTDDFSPPALSTDFNSILFNYTYPTAAVPQFFDLRLDAWEDDNNSDQLLGFCSNGNRCDYNAPQCCGLPVFGVCVGLNEGDDFRCDAQPFKTNMAYRLGPPCQWYNHGYVIGSGCGNNYYQPRIESYWRYTKGTSCNDAISLGSVAAGFSPISHFNSNECYANNLANSPGNDVFYEFTVTQGVGLRISLCAAANFNTALYLLDANCNVLEFNDDFCAQTSEINVPLCTPGTYRVVVDGAAAMDMGTFTLSLSENPAVIVNANAGSDLFTCLGIGIPLGGSPAAVGGNPGYTYSWSPATSLSNPSVANPVANPTVTTTYVLTVTDAANCAKTDTMVVNVLPGPSVNLGNDTTLCNNASFTLNAGPGNFYFWSNGATTPTIGVSQAGNYFVTVIDNFGCQGKDTISVSEYPDLTPALPPTLAICTGNSDTLDAGAGFVSYLWNSVSGGQFYPVNAAGTINLNVTDANNCSYQTNTLVSINPLPVPDLGSDTTVCPGDPVTLNPGAGYPAYSWNTGSIDQIISVTQPGTYSVTITDGNGCQQSDDVILSNFPVPPLNLGNDLAICNGGSAQITAPGGFASYFWSTGNTSPTITVSSTALYWVFGTDNFGCVYSDTVSVSVSPLLTLTEQNSGGVSCFGASDGFAQIGILGGSPPLSFSWNNGAVTQNLSDVSGGIYELTVTDANNCSQSLQVLIEEPAELALLLDVTDNTCDQTNAGAIEAKVVGGTPPYTYSWSTGENTPIIGNLAPGVYYATATDSSGCSVSDSAQVVTLNITLNQDEIIVPNIFTPNGDNINDIMTVEFPLTEYDSYEFSVLNRWGAVVFSTDNPAEYWDGGNNREGVYFYFMRVKPACGDPDNYIEKSGSVTLTR
jgi:gliding motility-associated-like protein